MDEKNMTASELIDRLEGLYDKENSPISPVGVKSAARGELIRRARFAEDALILLEVFQVMWPKSVSSTTNARAADLIAEWKEATK